MSTAAERVTPEHASAAAAGPVVRAAIHPAIGVARVGNSPAGFFIGPEVTEPAPLPAGGAKDAGGALKRQAARFRIYGYDAAGNVVGELTADQAEIVWTVSVANKKAAWYQFQLAMDIPEVASARPAALRNATVTGADRAKLVINPGPRTITGRNTSGPSYRCDTGKFYGKPVYLGELRTDEAGRLLFLGGLGASASYDNRPVQTFANNDGWRDDICDGPVAATVKVGGQAIPVDPAWVVTAPPNYAPDLLPVRTLHDLLTDVFITAGMMPAPTQVSFSRDVLPILRRMSGLQWVNHGFATRFGWGGADHFLDPQRLARLASLAPENAEHRHQVWSTFRDLDRDGVSPVPWPWIYGDAMTTPPAVSARQHLALTPTQDRALQRWAAGDFVADYNPAAKPPRTLAEVPLAGQPAMLDRAALTFCLADAFHPGCELTWPMRHATMYRAPFRIKPRPSGQPEPNYGATLTPQAALGPNGPLYVQAAGDLTRWMAVPWQADTASCRSGYSRAGQEVYDPYLPTFWPARVPNHVLTLADYRIVTDPTQPIDKRRAAFERRASWFRPLTGDMPNQRNQMVTLFGKMGVVEERPGVAGSADFPPRMLVESQPGMALTGVPPERNLRVVHVPEGQDLAAFAAAEGEPWPEDAVVGYDDKVARFPEHG